MRRLEIVAVRTSAPFFDKPICYEGMILDEAFKQEGIRRRSVKTLSI